MTRIYISDDGDDRNDGLSKETAIYSWQRAVKLCDGNTDRLSFSHSTKSRPLDN